MRIPKVGETWISDSNPDLIAIIKEIKEKKVYYTFVEDDDWSTSMSIAIFIDIYKFHSSKAEYLAKRRFDRDLKELIDDLT